MRFPARSDLSERDRPIRFHPERVSPSDLATARRAAKSGPRVWPVVLTAIVMSVGVSIVLGFVVGFVQHRTGAPKHVCGVIRFILGFANGIFWWRWARKRIGWPEIA